MKLNSWQKYSIQLAKAKINFYDPFQRLILRKIVEDILINTSSLRIDLFSIFDAVNKRGGFVKVEQQKRWVQIEYSLPYYKCNFRQIYMDHILKKQNQIKKYLKNYNRQYKTIDESFVQIHYIHATSSGGYYHFQDDQSSFCKQNFSHVDLYLNIKTICLTKSSQKKIIVQYADKYLITRKWLILKGYSKPFGDQQLEQLQIMKIINNNASIALIGWNIPNLLLAQRLHDLKFNIVLYTNLQNNYDNKRLQRVLCLQQGVFCLDDGVGGPFLYSQIFKNNGIEVAQVSNYCGLIDQNGKSIPQSKVRQSEQLFLALLADFKFQQNNKKHLISELLNLLARKKINDDLNLINWHIQRYIMLNDLHGQQTTVNFHFNYLNRRKHKIFMTKRKPIYIKSCQKFLQQSYKNFTIINSKPKTIDFSNNIWFVQERLNENKKFTSLIYSDTSQIYDMILKKNYKIPNLQRENFTILQDLSANRWVNCYFKFKTRLNIKKQSFQQLYKRKKDFQTICQFNISQTNCTFQLKGKFGFYYYFVIDEGRGLMATCRVQNYLANSSTSSQLKQTLCSQLLKKFQMHLLFQNLPQMSESHFAQYSNFFYLKQQALSRDKIIKLKSWQRMYLLLGFPWSLNAQKLTSQIDIANQILALITNAHYHLYRFDQKAKQCFSFQYRNQKNKETSKRQNLAKDQNARIVGRQQISIYNDLQNKLSENKQITRSNSQNKIVIQSPNQQTVVKSDATIKSNGLNCIIQEKQVPMELQNQVQRQNNPVLKIHYNVSPSIKDLIQYNIQKYKPEINVLKKQIPITNNKSFLQSDPFGINHPFIQKSLSYIQNIIRQTNSQIQLILKAYYSNNNLNIAENKQVFDSSQLAKVQQQFEVKIRQFNMVLQLQRPYKLDSNSYLHNFGDLTINHPDVKNILMKFRQAEEQLLIYQENKTLQSNTVNINHEIQINILDKYMVKQQYYNLQDPNKTAIYVNCILFIQSQYQDKLLPFYVIFQQSNLSTFYYHTSLNRLAQAFDNYLTKRRQILKSNHPFYRTSQKNSLCNDTSRIYLLLGQVKQKIQDQLKQAIQQQYLSYQDNLSKILIQKLNSQVPEQFYQHPQSNDLYNKITYPQTSQQKTKFLMNAINDFCKQQLKLYNLRPDITFIDIFFGYLSKKYLIYELLFSRYQKNLKLLIPNSSTKNIAPKQIQSQNFQQILEQMKKKDPHLYKQFQSILTQNCLHQDYHITFQYDKQNIRVQRTFLAGKNDCLRIKSEKSHDIQVQGSMKSLNEDKEKKKKKKPTTTTNNSLTYYISKQQMFKKYIFIKKIMPKQCSIIDKRNEKVRCYLVIGDNAQSDNKIDMDPRQNPLELIISILVDTWSEGQIYRHFTQLITNQIFSCQYTLPNTIKLYYQSTRKQNLTILGAQQLNDLKYCLGFRSRNVSKVKAPKQGYPTEYLTDDDDRETIYQNIEEGNMVFVDREIIICKY